MTHRKLMARRRSLARSIYDIETLESRTMLAVSPLALDTTFGTGGAVTTDINGDASSANAIAVQSDGKILVAGSAYYPGNKSFAGGTFAVVLRYNADGTLDDGGPNDSTPADRFGSNGEVFDLYDNGAFGLTTAYDAVAIQSDGKIVLGGQITVENNSTFTYQSYWFFTRLNSDGSLDTSYGANGHSYANFADNNTDSTLFGGMVMQPDNKIVVVGTFVNQWVVSRINSSGLFDTTFGSAHTGYEIQSFNTGGPGIAVALDHLGDIVVAGSLDVGNGYRNVQVARYLSDGTLDDSFSGEGTALFYDTPQHYIGKATIAIQASGDILVDIQRHHANEILDFSNNGAPLRNPGFSADAQAIVVAANDEPFLAGTSFANSNSCFDVTELDAPQVHGLGAQIISNSLGSNGSVAAIGPDGAIIVAGAVYFGSVQDIAVERFTGEPPGQFGTIKGHVFVDLDGDGVQDKNEAGVPNARVFIDTNNDAQYNPATNNSSPERSILTDANGNYTFSGLLPATYKLEVVVPSGDTRTLPGKPGLYSVTVAAATTVKGKIFGLRPPVKPVGSTSISGSVYNDTNANGKRDISNPIDPDLVSWQVFLDLNDDGKREKGEPLAITDVSGNFLFSKLSARTYRVTEIRPKGWRSTNPVSGYFDVVLKKGKNVPVHFGNTTK